MRKLFVSLCLLLTWPAVGQSLLWEVSGNGLRQPSYLFGTYHLLGDDFVKTRPAVQKAYIDAQGVVVEMVIDSSKILQMAMRGMMLNNSLDKLLPPADYDLVAATFKAQTGMDLTLFNRMKPVLTGMMFGQVYMKKQLDSLSALGGSGRKGADLFGSAGGQPMDLYFAANGKQTGKTVLPLETMEEQITLLYDHDPVEKQAQDFLKLIKEMDSVKDQSRSLTRLYLAGDLDGLYNLMQTAQTEPGSMAHLLDERNANWMKRLPALLAARPTFVAVGAGHLPGPNGLIALLRKDGFTVKAVK
jgi:uncharacterized protein